MTDEIKKICRWIVVAPAYDGKEPTAKELDDHVRADYICDGVNDENEIQAAIDHCESNEAVQLLEGTYHLNGSIKLKDGFLV